jgi:hypothetical protein
MNIKLVKYIENDFDLFKTTVDDDTMKYIAEIGWTKIPQSNQSRKWIYRKLLTTTLQK